MMNIRRANINDAETLSKLASKTFFDTFTGTCTQQDMEQFLHHYYNTNQIEMELKNANDFYYLYEVNDIAIAYIRIGEDYSGFDELKQYKALELKRLYVLQEFHSKGVAQELMNFIIDFAYKNKYNLIWLGVWEYNFKAQHFYKKYEFTNTGYSHPFPIGNTPQTDLWYWKKLN